MTDCRGDAGGIYSFFSAFARGMTRADAAFHAAMAAVLVLGGMAVGGAGDFLWGKWNDGVMPQILPTSKCTFLSRQRC